MGQRLTDLGIAISERGDAVVLEVDELPGPVTYALSPPRSRFHSATGLCVDLDGTSLDSERFWIETLRLLCSDVLGHELTFTPGDAAVLQGASTREHLRRCITRFGLDIAIDDAHRMYDALVETRLKSRSPEDLSRELRLRDGFVEIRNLARSIAIPLVIVTNGNQEKAERELQVMAHQLIERGVEGEVCDAIVCAPERSNGVLMSFGAWCGKPHPWPYALGAARCLDLGADLEHVVGVDDSAAGVCSARLAGLITVGVLGGNVAETGAGILCDVVVPSLGGAVETVASWSAQSSV